MIHTQVGPTSHPARSDFAGSPILGASDPRSPTAPSASDQTPDRRSDLIGPETGHPWVEGKGIVKTRSRPPRRSPGTTLNRLSTLPCDSVKALVAGLEEEQLGRPPHPVAGKQTEG
jgi:hypothetical protein